MASVPPLTDIRQLGPRTARTGAFILCRVPAVMRNEMQKTPAWMLRSPGWGVVGHIGCRAKRRARRRINSERWDLVPSERWRPPQGWPPTRYRASTRLSLIAPIRVVVVADPDPLPAAPVGRDQTPAGVVSTVEPSAKTDSDEGGIPKPIVVKSVGEERSSVSADRREPRPAMRERVLGSESAPAPPSNTPAGYRTAHTGTTAPAATAPVHRGTASAPATAMPAAMSTAMSTLRGNSGRAHA